MKTAPIDGASRKSTMLMWASVACVVLSIVSLMMIMFHLAMTISSLALYIAHRLLLKKSANNKMLELKCESCGWRSQT